MSETLGAKFIVTHSLADLLRSRGLDPATIVAIRNDLHPGYVSSDFRTIADLKAANVLHMYDRMQDGPRIAHDSRVLSFMALPKGRAKLTAFRRFSMRRPGIAPGDIIYDYDAAHLLHSFIAHAANPVFYDTVDEPDFDDLIGQLGVQWPEPLEQDIRAASDVAIKLIANES